MGKFRSNVDETGFYYERLLSSQDKDLVRNEIIELENSFEKDLEQRFV